MAPSNVPVKDPPRAGIKAEHSESSSNGEPEERRPLRPAGRRVSAGAAPGSTTDFSADSNRAEERNPLQRPPSATRLHPGKARGRPRTPAQQRPRAPLHPWQAPPNRLVLPVASELETLCWLPVSSRCSQDRARFHLFFTVAGETPITSAVSSIVIRRSNVTPQCGLVAHPSPPAA